MNVRKSWLSGLVVLVLCAAAVRGEREPAPLPIAPESIAVRASPAKTATPIESELMPMGRIEHPTPLDQQIEAIRAAIPGFNCVIVRDPGVAGDYPTLPAMTLKNVTVGQFLQFVEQSFDGVKYRRIDGPAGALHTVRVELVEKAMARDRDEEEANRVRLYRLADVIRALDADVSVLDVPTTQKSPDARMKEATNQVLSLLQEALDETEPNTPRVVKIHEPTLTLLFKGSTAQQRVLQETLSTLYPQGRWSPTPSLTPSYPKEFERQYQLRWEQDSDLLPRQPRPGGKAERAGSGASPNLSEKDLKRTADEVVTMHKELSRRLADVKALQDQLERQLGPTATVTTTTKPAKE